MRRWILSSLAPLMVLAPGCKKARTLERDLAKAQVADELTSTGACPYAPGTDLHITYTMTADKGPQTTVERTYTVPRDARTNAAPSGKSYSTQLGSFTAAFPAGMKLDVTPSVMVDDFESPSCKLTLGAITGNRTAITASGAPDLPPFTDLSWTATVSAGAESTTQTFHETANVSCMDEHTPIAMADGSRVAIRELVVGDRLLDPVTGATVRVARIIHGPEPYRPTVSIATGGASVVFSEHHPILTLAGIKAARDVSPGDVLRGADGATRAIARLAALPPRPSEVVYNVELEGDSSRWEDHVILAGGIAVGDWWMQEKIRK